MKNPYPRSTLASLLLAACLVLASVALAVDPPPDGGYPRHNTAEGDDALLSLTFGTANTAVGFNALFSTTKGSSNTAMGASTLAANTSGGSNTAAGSLALMGNTTGGGNTGIGASALQNNTTGFNNTATGVDALLSNTTGVDNIAIGASALRLNTIGSNNTALGGLSSNTVGGSNTAIGASALSSNTTGIGNIALGFAAGSLTTGSNNIDIGHQGVADEYETIRIGTPRKHSSAYIAGIDGSTVAGGVGVIIDSTGHLGTVTSSARYKRNIQPMKDASDKILSLRPVTFEYKENLDPAGIPQFGLVAEDVAKVDPDLVARDEQGQPFTVRYEAVNAMLLNEFIKEHRKTEEQGRDICDLKATVSELKSQLSAVTATLKEQAAELQKVSNHLIKPGPVPRVVADN